MRHKPHQPQTAHRSYWLRPSNYYMLTAAAAIAVFFLMLGLLQDGGEEAPWLASGLAASLVLVGGVIVRLAILQKLIARHCAQQRLDRNLMSQVKRDTGRGQKLTIEKNASILRELQRKSDAAFVLARLPEGHREVFELSGEYLEINEKEMMYVNPGSPRIAALRRGREIADELHRKHMLRWAEIESRSLLEDAQLTDGFKEKLERAKSALAVINTASSRYPDETMLSDSASAIEEFVNTIMMADLIDRAGRAAARGKPELARKLYSEAMVQIRTRKDFGPEAEFAISRLKDELERLDGAGLP